MSSHYQEVLSKITNMFAENEIQESDMSFFKENFNQESVIEILKSILGNQEVLKKVAERSYTHALGFDKIVLMDLSKDIEGLDVKTQLRLHLWDAQNEAVPMVESMHEHSFNFISTVLSGKLENQIFKIQEITNKEQIVLDKLSSILKIVTLEEKIFINNQLEILEAIKLDKLNSMQFKELSMSKNYNLDKLKELTNFTLDELLLLTAIQGHYVSNRVRGEKKAYKHIFDKHLKVVPYEVLHIEQGEYYFHHYQYPHRLYYDNKIFNSTILITTPVKDNPQGGSLQRPTYINESEKDYDKKSIPTDQLKLKLEEYIDFLSSK